MLSHERIANIVSENASAALCIVTSTTGSTPRKAGARMVVFANGTDTGRIEGTIGGGAVEHEVRKRAIEVMTSLRPQQFTIALTNELGMCCGGQMTLFVEPLRSKPPCILIGAGHIAHALAALAPPAGFSLHVCDPRPDLLEPQRFPFASQLQSGYHKSDLEQMPFGADAFVVIATHSHQADQELVEEILPRDFRYIALVGSKRKAAMTRQRCQNKGFNEGDISRLHCPAGIDINAETPEEIAVSILAQMIQVRRSAV